MKLKTTYDLITITKQNTTFISIDTSQHLISRTRIHQYSKYLSHEVLVQHSRSFLTWKPNETKNNILHHRCRTTHYKQNWCKQILKIHEVPGCIITSSTTITSVDTINETKNITTTYHKQKTRYTIFILLLPLSRTSTSTIFPTMETKMKLKISYNIDTSEIQISRTSTSPYSRFGIFDLVIVLRQPFLTWKIKH